LNVTQVVEDGVLVPSTCELSSKYPFAVSLNVGWLAVLVSACDGKKPAAALLDEMKQRGVMPPDAPESQFLRDLRTLISCGFLEIEQFPLPKKK
jgi:hypothetical protein